MALARLIQKSGTVPGTVIELRPGLNRIGRNPANDIVISDISVSSFHCEITVAGIAVAVRDLDSTNGTFINAKRIQKAVFQTGDLLTLGSVDFAVDLPEAHIAIPDQPNTEPQGAAFLEDGTPACMIHRDVAATLRCTKCENFYCPSCVREVKRLTNNPALRFCPECSAACEPIPLYTPEKKKVSFFGKLQETLRLTLKK